MNPIREIVFKGIDGKQVVVILDESFGYYSILGACEGAVSEFIVRPRDDDEEYDG
jgi:hypothetical protein